MQVYRGMEIGSGAPSPEERARVPHHFVACLEPGAPYSAGRFQEWARPVVGRLNAMGKPAVAAGGSGLYVRALIDGLFEGPPANEGLRERLWQEAEDAGVAALHARLEQLDPEYAAITQRGDLKRIVRALEVIETAGRPFSELHREHQALVPKLDAVQVALDYPREVLYERINRRVDAMLEAGLVEEVQALVQQGYRPALEHLRSLGYPEMLAYLDGRMGLEDAAEEMKKNTRRFAKRQLSWFRPDPRIIWLPPHENASEREGFIQDILARVTRPHQSVPAP